MQLIRVDNNTLLRFIGWVLVAVGAVWLVFILQRPLVWFAGAAFLAVALNPAVEWIIRRFPKWSRLAATSAVFLIFVLIGAFLAYSFVPPLVKEASTSITSVPGYLQQLQHGNNFVADYLKSHDVAALLRQYSGDIIHSTTGAGSGVLSAVGSVFSGVVAILTVLALTFFMMLEGPSWVETFWKSLPAKVAKRHRPVVARMYATVTGFVTGNLLTSLLVAILTAILLIALSVPYSIPLAIVVGLLDLVPLGGATIAAAIVVIVALFTSWLAAIIMAVFFVVYQQVENHILQPLVYSRTIQMSPLLVLISAIIGAYLGGILGAVVAIPVGASIRIAVEEYVLAGRAKQS